MSPFLRLWQHLTYSAYRAPEYDAVARAELSLALQREVAARYGGAAQEDEPAAPGKRAASPARLKALR